MPSTVKISLPGLAVAVVLPVAVAAYAVGGGHPAPASAASSGSATTRQIVMEGQGKATGVPDMMRFTVGVSVTRSDVGAAMDEANRTMKKVLDSLRSRGITGRDVKTTGLSVDPQYDYSGGHERLTGYAVNERLRVRVRHLAASGKAIAAVAAVGGNAVRVNEILLDISDRSALLKQARESAMADATEKAGEYAAAGNVGLGHVISVKEIRTDAPSQPAIAYDARNAAGAVDSVKQVPVRAGQQELDVSVQVVWALD